MTYVLIRNGAVAKYPYSIEQLRADNPNTSFSANPPVGTLAEWNVFPVTRVPVPAPTPTENFVQGLPTFSGGQWTQVWVSQPATPEEIAARAEQAALESELSTAKLDQWVTQFLAMTPSGAQDYILNNSATLAALRVNVGRIAYVARFLIKREINR